MAIYHLSGELHSVIATMLDVAKTSDDDSDSRKKKNNIYKLTGKASKHQSSINSGDFPLVSKT
jgi:hypothetical protein